MISESYFVSKLKISKIERMIFESFGMETFFRLF